jgi:transcription antitermination factor NusG
MTRRMRRIGILPGYVFSDVDRDRDLTTLLRRIVGAIDVARTFSGAPLLIGDADIQIIRKIEIGLNTPRPDKLLHNFKSGEKVRFVDDLMGRWPPGRIIKLAPDGRISVEVEMMGRKVAITCLPHQIERI